MPQRLKVYQKKQFDETNRGTLFREERPKRGSDRPRLFGQHQYRRHRVLAQWLDQGEQKDRQEVFVAVGEAEERADQD
jgi:hypothetical protein